MRRRREISVLNTNTVLTAIVFYLLLIDAKDIPTNTQTAAEMFMNPTEMFESTGTSAIHSDDDNELSGDDVQTSTHMPMPMTLHTTISAAATANTIETIMEEQSNRLFVATDGMGEQQQQQRHFTVPNETSHHQHTTTNVTLVSYNLSNFNNISNNSNSSMTLSSHDNNRNSSNISFNNIKFTTMKPLIVPTLPDFTRHRLGGQKQYQSKHHHDRHFGPFFEDPLNTSGTLQLEFHEGTESILNCRVGMLKDKTVMWVRRTVDKVSLLTVGNVTYSGDPRIKVSFIYPNNWRLSISPIKSDDGGLYMCQVSTHPPRVFATNLTVLAPAIRLVDEMGHEVSDRYYKLGSGVDITCQVALTFLNTIPSSSSTTNLNEKFLTSLATTTSTTTTTTFPFIDTNLIRKNHEYVPYTGNHIIHWKKDGKDLPKDIKISMSITHTWRTSRISIIHAEKVHSGTYTCSVLNSTASSSVNIQILMGERHEAVQHNHCSNAKAQLFIFVVGVMLIFYPNLYISKL